MTKEQSGARNQPASRVRRVTRNLLRAVDLAWAASARSLALYAVLGTISAAMPPVATLLTANLVDALIESDTRSDQSMWMLSTLLGLWLVTAVQRTTNGYLGLGRHLFARRVQLEAERRLLEKVCRVDMGDFDNSDWHDRLARAQRDVASRPGDLVWSVLGLSGNIVTVTIATGMLASLHVSLAVLALFAAGMALAVEHRVTALLYQFLYEEAPEERERNYVSDLLIQPRTTKEVRAHGLADYLLSRYATLSERLLNRREQVYKAVARVSVVSGLIGATALAIAYGFVAAEVSRGTVAPGAVVLLVGVFTAVSSALAALSSTFSTVDQHTAFLDDYFAFLAIEPRVRRSGGEGNSLGVIDRLELRDVSFAYNHGKRLALSGFSLAVNAGELIAVVGENGAGKSTFVKLILRFYDADTGSVLVNGVDVKQFDPEALRRRIGVLFQDYATYELSIRENVAMGRPDDCIDDRRVADALRGAGLGRLVASMAKGLDGRVGRMFEGGRDLSGGEWQRLALARLIYRDADIWILDEPTASLDPEAEAAIFGELRQHLKGRLGIMISHRFSTVRTADRIALVADGRVAELGTHEELLRLNGRYARLFELQACGYR